MPEDFTLDDLELLRTLVDRVVAEMEQARAEDPENDPARIAAQRYALLLEKVDYLHSQYRKAAGV